jgi:hypothetical protein
MNGDSYVRDFQTDTNNSRSIDQTIRNPVILGMTLPFLFAGPEKLSLDQVLKIELWQFACYPAFHPGSGDPGLAGWRLRAAGI